MANVKSRAGRAATLHRQATATVVAAAATLDATRPAPVDQRKQHDLAERLRTAAALLTPGWSGADLETLPATHPPDNSGPPSFVRVGVARPLEDAWFPAVVPLLGTGHLTVDADARDDRVAGLVRAVLLRLLAASPTGSLLVRAVSGSGTADVFAPFASLADAGLLPPPAVDHTGLRGVLDETEQWVTSARPSRHPRHDRALLLVITTLPESIEPAELDRISRLADQGPAAGLHLIVAGWPPPSRASEPARPPLPHATPVTLRNPYALVGDPPGATFGSTGGQPPPAGLNCPVFLDPAPDSQLIDQVCRRLAARVHAESRLRLGDLLPSPMDELWTASAADGLTTPIGDADGRPVSLGFTDLTPHWLVSGRTGAGKTAFLTNVLFGLAARYGPEELAVYLVDLAEGESFASYLQTERDRAWLPQVRAAGLQVDREYVLAVLAEIDAEVTRRGEVCRQARVTRFAELRQRERLPRIICVIENFPLLLAEPDRIAAEASRRLESVARGGRSYGVHLLLAGIGAPGVGTHPTGRDPVLAPFPVRVALPGGSAVLAPANDAAAGLPLGSAVVNTAGGLGGPRGATRGHERVVRFPDPQADPEQLTALRQRLWAARPANSVPPAVFAGYARPHLANDPRYRAALAGQPEVPVALLGRAVDVSRTSVGFPLGPVSGRHLAVLGTTEDAVRLLATAARTVAAHHGAGTVRFVVAPLLPGTVQAGAALAAELAERQPVSTVDTSGLVDALGSEQPAYLVVFGMDVLDPAELPADRLREVLRAGPARGSHLLCWWREVHRLTSWLGEAVAAGELAGLVALDVPGAQLAPLFGESVEWQPRPDRALLRDLHTDQTTVLVPYAETGVGA